MTERHPLAIVQLEAWPDTVAAAVAGADQAVGVRPDPTPLTAVTAGAATALWLGPARWQIVEPEAERGPNGLYAALETALGENAALTDQGHGRVCLRIAGPALTATLAGGCTLDLDPGGACDPGRVVNTALGHMAATIHRLDAETADLYVARSYAVSFFEWLSETAAEFGCRVAPPETA